MKRIINKDTKYTENEEFFELPLSVVKFVDYTRRERLVLTTRRFRFDKWNRIIGSRVPNGAEVEIVKFMPKRRVLIQYNGLLLNTMLWCVPKERVG